MSGLGWYHGPSREVVETLNALGVESGDIISVQQYCSPGNEFIKDEKTGRWEAAQQLYMGVLFAQRPVHQERAEQLRAQWEAEKS